MKMRFTALTLLMQFVFYSAFSQTTLGKKIKVMPADYLAPTGLLAVNDKFLPVMPQNLWIVYSESDGTYSNAQPGGELKNFKKMNYMEAFYVIDQKAEWLQLAKWEPLQPNRDLDIKTGELKKELEYYGWIQEDKMLAWRHCLVDPVSKFTIKALTASNNECMKNPEACTKTKVLKLYNNPGLTIENKNDVRLFEFLYIYKRKGQSVLVGRQDDLVIGESKLASKKILGWISASVIKEWKQRLVLEPNWDASAVSERKSKKVKTSIFYTPESGRKFLDDPTATEDYESQVLWEKDPYDKPWPAELKRLPLLDANVKDIESMVIKTGSVSPIFNRDGKVAFETQEEVNLRRQSAEQRENFRKINIIFLIDGSRYMKTFQTNILQTVANFGNSLKNLEDQDGDEESSQKNTFKVGAVIYRGTQDVKCGGEDLSTQTQELTPHYNEVVEFLNEKLQKTGCSDKEPTKAYYKGFLQALRQFGNCKKQSNIIIVIGSAGNSDDPGYQQLKKSVQANLIEYQVGILAFQVLSGYDKYYIDFLKQTRDLILTTATAIQDSISTLTDTDFPKPELIKGNHLAKLICPGKSPIPGEVMYADESAPMDADTLQANILALIDETINSKENILDGIDSKLNGIGTKLPINPGMLLYLKNMNIEEASLRKAAYENVQLYVEGYTAYKPSGFNNPLYKMCVFISEGELNYLIESLRRIQSPSSGSKDIRVRMEDGFKSIVSTYYGAREAKKIIATKTGADLLAMLSGLPTKNPILQKFHLDQISNKKVVTDADLQNLASEIDEKISALTNYAADDRNYFKSFDKRYAWVPGDYFP